MKNPPPRTNMYICPNCERTSEFVILQKGACERIEHKLNCSYTRMSVARGGNNIEVFEEWNEDEQGNFFRRYDE